MPKANELCLIGRFIMFDFSILLKQIITAYNKADIPWTKDDVIEFFMVFYKTYMSTTGYEHPRLKTNTIQTIIEKLSEDDMFEYSLDDYKEMIPKYFRTKFSDCDYSIVHFMSGSIRQMRFFEVCY